jgi:hypothetical protein
MITPIVWLDMLTLGYFVLRTKRIQRTMAR